MILIGGVGSRVKQAGSAPCVCPACGRQATLHGAKRYSVVTLFFIPVIPFGGEYIVTCSACASVMTLDKARGKQLEHGTLTGLSPEELHVLQNNAGPACPQCGSRVAPSNAFCPSCGHRL